MRKAFTKQLNILTVDHHSSSHFITIECRIFIRSSMFKTCTKVANGESVSLQSVRKLQSMSVEEWNQRRTGLVLDDDCSVCLNASYALLRNLSHIKIILHVFFKIV